MNKAQLIEAVALETKLSKIAAQKVVDAVIKTTVQTLREGNKLTLSGLGSFSIVQQSARVGRNPRSGAVIKIPPRKVVKFRSVIEVE